MAELSKKLEELDPLIHSPDAVTEGGVSYDDIDLFGKVRHVRVVCVCICVWTHPLLTLTPTHTHHLSHTHNSYIHRRAG